MVKNYNYIIIYSVCLLIKMVYICLGLKMSFSWGRGEKKEKKLMNRDNGMVIAGASRVVGGGEG